MKQQIPPLRVNFPERIKRLNVVKEKAINEIKERAEAGYSVCTIMIDTGYGLDTKDSAELATMISNELGITRDTRTPDMHPCSHTFIIPIVKLGETPPEPEPTTPQLT